VAALSSEWARTLLDGRHYATLATVDADSSLHQTPVWYMFRDAQLYVGTSSFTRKYRNVMARPTASLVVDLRTPGAERWVSCAGPVTILRGDESRAIVAAIHERYLTPDALADPQIGPVFAGGDDVTLCISPSTWRSWTAADLDARFFGGRLSADPGRWFRPLD
jgi:PPOX class probable F420-dependent enzyme